MTRLSAGVRNIDAIRIITTRTNNWTGTVSPHSAGAIALTRHVPVPYTVTFSEQINK